MRSRLAATRSKRWSQALRGGRLTRGLARRRWRRTRFGRGGGSLLVSRRRVLRPRVLRARQRRWPRPKLRLPAAPPGAVLVRWLFLRALGVTSLVAWTSLTRQVRGLYGRRGLAPIAERMELLRERAGERRVLRWPTIFWVDASDRTLVATCRAGQLLSLLLTLNLAPRWSSALSWGAYVSFASVGAPFLSYQWDALLLEMGGLATVIAPGGLRPKLGRRAPSWAAVMTMRWLAFRLHFESGVAKLQSGDETWRKLTACTYHQETQPLPTPLGWYAHHLPRRANQAATAGVLLFETAAPVLALLPGPLRRAGFWSLTALQAAIAATGNYGFFNLLSGAAALWLLDDEQLARARGHVSGRRPRVSPDLPPAPGWHQTVELAALLPLWLASADELLARFRPHLLPKWIAPVLDTPRLLHAVSPYGLFAVMTTERPEIVLEGSMDGETWREYGFRYKPGELTARPRFVAPHMPRLDWQLWFAALGRIEPWLFRLLRRIQEGAPEVMELMGKDPFGGARPRHVRAVMYDYRMSSLEERRNTGTWWRREYLGVLGSTRPAESARA